MKIFLPFYLKISKKKFEKHFKPLGIKKKLKHLVSAPYDARNFFRAASFLVGLSKIGSVVILMPKILENIFSFLKPKLFEIIFYENPPTLFSEDYRRIEMQIANREFNFLIELNEPANISLPYLIKTDRRVSFYEKINFPYYNILIKDGYNSLSSFFNISEENPQELFYFHARDLKNLEKKLRKKKPLLFINGTDNIEWKGGKVILGQDVSAEDADAYKALYIADCYYGKNDAFFEFAKIFNKKLYHINRNTLNVE